MSFRVAIVAPVGAPTALMQGRLERSPAVAACVTLPDDPASIGSRLASAGVETIVYAAGSADPGDVSAALSACRDAGTTHAVVLSSTAVHVPSHKHPGRVDEDFGARRSVTDPVAAGWRALENAARTTLDGSATRLTILRPAPVLLRGGNDFFSRLLARRVALTLAGHDPTLQFLSPQDLADAVATAVTASPGGVFQITPSAAIPLHRALRLAGVRRLPLPRWLHRAVRAVAAPPGLAAPQHQVDRLRYCWTARGERAERQLGFRARRSSADAVRGLAGHEGAPDGERATRRVVPDIEPHAERDDRRNGEQLLAFDAFGLDLERIAAWRRRHIKFLHDVYWRVEVAGTENLPRYGAAVAVGIHRGFMPFDGVMALNAIVGATGRCPRFLIHPGLVKFPFLADYMLKLGGVIACRDNADYLLERDEVVAVFPEGIRGAFTYYRDAYRLGNFGRPDYVRMALRHRAPIVPFVTVGSAEIFPILAKIDWGWWKRYTEWPCLPLTPTFPLLPVPLPSKWHTRFLEPLPVQDSYPPEAADDADLVARIDREVQSQMAAALEEMLRQRRSVWYGSIFGDGTDEHTKSGAIEPMRANAHSSRAPRRPVSSPRPSCAAATEDKHAD